MQIKLWPLGFNRVMIVHQVAAGKGLLIFRARPDHTEGMTPDAAWELTEGDPNCPEMIISFENPNNISKLILQLRQLKVELASAQN